jgi:hypothetical protein
MILFNSLGVFMFLKMHVFNNEFWKRIELQKNKRVIIKFVGLRLHFEKKATDWKIPSSVLKNALDATILK